MENMQTDDRMFKRVKTIYMRYICEYQIDFLSTFFKSIFNFKLVCLFLTIYLSSDSNTH